MESDDNIETIIRNYESVIDTLTTQVEFYAKEQENLRREIPILIQENKDVRQTLNEVLACRTNVTSELDNQRDKELIENLKIQINLSLKEKDTVVALWQSALKTIDHLEEELKLFEGRTHGYFSKTEVLTIKKKYENRIAELQEHFTKCQDKLENTIKDFTIKMEKKNANLKIAVECRENTTTLVKRLEIEVQSLQERLKEIMKMRDKLQKTLDAKTDMIEEFKIKDIQAKGKVTEAIQIVEAAFFEKDAALLRENEAKKEVVKISKTLSEVIDEATEKVKGEIEKLKQEHEEKMKKLLQHLQKLKQEVQNKNIQLDKCTKECKLLEEELERVKKGNISIDESNMSKLLILEKNLESTFQKLLLAERKNVQVMSEKDSLKADMEQMANYYKGEVKRRELEKVVLQHEVQSLKKQLKATNNNFIQAAGNSNKLNSKIRLLDGELKDKLQTKEIMYKQTLNNIIEDILNKNTKVQEELFIHLEKRTVLNKTWKKEVYEIIKKLEFRMKELKKLNKSLRNELDQTIVETLHYKHVLTCFCRDVKNVTNKIPF